MNTKPKWLAKNKKVLEWEREPDGICVVTEYGWAFEPGEHDAGHIHIFENSKEARARLKTIRPCACPRCVLRGQDVPDPE
jgi:hypothetical protein